ncbi:hypothetical protein Rs2_51441 [Raphanus sativus]|uniref:Uncharacterized protein LOC108808657 n=1 Tax=Raphanus sativus TaxID=3726 RepID=A0A6J0JKX4_RAPSA|nr:uncharacterized protein LOC108808657 [Raphanus sativus]KAJ4867015.1 hypothetical protein Rs2_51441 [Raphanus sativus]
MEVTKTSRKKTFVGHQVLDKPKRNPYSLLKSIEVNEKMVEDMQQQILKMERKITEKKLYHEKAISGLKDSLRYGYIYNEKWGRIDDERSFPYCSKKMELDKLTFANNAYRDKKAVISFSSGKREINTHNLNHRMLHEAQSMDGERRLLKMLSPSKDDDSEFPLEEIERQMWQPYSRVRWPGHTHKPSTMEIKECERKLRELERKRDQLFVNAPCKASLWSSLPSTKVLRNQIQAMEVRDEENRKVVLLRRKKIESKERKIKKAEKEIKSMNKMVEMISNRKQRAMESISHQKSCVVV